MSYLQRCSSYDLNCKCKQKEQTVMADNGNGRQYWTSIAIPIAIVQIQYWSSLTKQFHPLLPYVVYIQSVLYEVKHIHTLNMHFIFWHCWTPHPPCTTDTIWYVGLYLSIIVIYTKLFQLSIVINVWFMAIYVGLPQGLPTSFSVVASL